MSRVLWGVTSLAKSVADRWGEIDIWINNAGDTVVGDSMDLNPMDFAQIIDLNLNGVFCGSQVAARQMAAPRRAAYCVSKACIGGTDQGPRG